MPISPRRFLSWPRRAETYPWRSLAYLNSAFSDRSPCARARINSLGSSRFSSCSSVWISSSSFCLILERGSVMACAVRPRPTTTAAESKAGGEGGIRTPDTLLGCNCLAGSPVRPLQHLSAVRLAKSSRSLRGCREKYSIAGKFLSPGAAVLFGLDVANHAQRLALADRRRGDNVEHDSGKRRADLLHGIAEEVGEHAKQGAAGDALIRLNQRAEDARGGAHRAASGSGEAN